MEQQPKVAILLSSIPEWFWKVSMPVLGVVVVGADYFLGQAYYTAWLQAFQVDGNVFARAHETILIYGALAFLHAGVGLTTWAGAHRLAMVCTVLYFAFWFALWSLADHCRPRIERWDEARGREVRHPHVARFFYRLFVLLCVVLLFFLGIPVLGAIMSLPGAIGETAGTAAAREDRADYV
ncbi:hypothetical protein B0G62_103165 [Paraburkholderia eburnea]|uniref:Uncharacterized protein n=1 Tax=Paraburkholderia eburnea TaxID=1189126 RepID=A0A2S4MFR4_9BURK|nr:hypothetical protein [Paraburkholderia eburnea]POR53593.1 hypothetical protein B0G62_103165 [Paraburkholderia eburnea]PRZ25561.1 hypothetical protein BX588_102165 [Paraburkholderia eburnea]